DGREPALRLPFRPAAPRWPLHAVRRAARRRGRDGRAAGGRSHPGVVFGVESGHGEAHHSLEVGFEVELGFGIEVEVEVGLEAELLFALLALYELPARGPAGRLRLYALWAGAGFADAAKGAGLRLGANALGRAIAGSLPARIIARLNPLLLRAILHRLGLGWLPRALKLWLLLGAPVAFALDRAALRALGSAAVETLEASQK